MAAAVSDYTPARQRKTKLKKRSTELIIKLKPTADILAWAGKHKNESRFIVGFALEDRNIRTNAEKKMRTKNLDMIIANKPETISADKARVEIKVKDKNWKKLPLSEKEKIARQIIDVITQNFSQAG